MSQLSLCQFNSWIISTLFSSGLLPLRSAQILFFFYFSSVCVSPPQALSVHEKTTPSLSLFKPAANKTFLFSFSSEPQSVVVSLIAPRCCLAHAVFLREGLALLKPVAVTQRPQLHLETNFTRNGPQKKGEEDKRWRDKQSRDIASVTVCPSELTCLFMSVSGKQHPNSTAVCSVNCCSQYRGVWAPQRGWSISHTDRLIRGLSFGKKGIVTHRWPIFHLLHLLAPVSLSHSLSSCFVIVGFCVQFSVELGSTATGPLNFGSFHAWWREQQVLGEREWLFGQRRRK